MDIGGDTHNGIKKIEIAGPSKDGADKQTNTEDKIMTIPSYLTPGQQVDKFEDLEEDEFYKRGTKMLVIKKFTKSFVRFFYTPDYLNEEPKEYLRKVKEKQGFSFFEIAKCQIIPLDYYWIKNGNYDEEKDTLAVDALGLF